MYIHTNGNTYGALISDVDSIYYNDDSSDIYFAIGDTLASFQLADVDSLTFGDDSETVFINYNESAVTVYNPLAFQGVTVNVDNANVVVNSTIEDNKIDYELSGSTSDGMFKLYGNYKFNLILNGVDITNEDGPAINIQTGKKCDLTLEAGTENSLADGSSYADSDEDQKGTLFSEGQIVFQGTGSLAVYGNYKHAICSDDYISVEEGDISVLNAVKDGIHTNDYFDMSGGSLSISSTGDGIDGDEGYISISDGEITIVSESDDVKGISCDSTITVNGGTVNLTVSGDQSKGLKSKQDIYLNGGKINIETSGNAVLESSGSGYDPSYCTAIKSSASVIIDSCDIVITAAGLGGKGISADENIEINGGDISIETTGGGNIYTDEEGETDAYSSTCLTADTDIMITAGTLTLSSSGAGGKGIKADNTLTIGSTSTTPDISITTTGSEITSGNESYASPKALKADGDVTFLSGTTLVSSADDGIKSETNVYFYGGTITVEDAYEGVEAPTIYVSGAYVDVTATDDGVNATAGTGSASDDGSWLYVTSGTLIANCTGGDAIDSNGSVEISGGLVITNGPSAGDGEAIDVNASLLINGGTVIASGIPMGGGGNRPGGGGSSTSGEVSSSSTQPSIEISSQSQISSSTFIDVRIGDSDVITFKPKYGGTSFIVSSADITQGSSYTIYTGGSYSTDTNTEGYYTSGSYTPGTSKKTGTISSTSTVNVISF